MPNPKKFTCDNCPYRGCHEFSEMWFDKALWNKYYCEDDPRRTGLTGYVMADRADDACFFNPAPVKCPPQEWCGRHPSIRSTY